MDLILALSNFNVRWGLKITSDLKEIVIKLQTCHEEFGYILKEEKITIKNMPEDSVEDDNRNKMADELDRISFDIYVSTLAVRYLLKFFLINLYLNLVALRVSRKQEL
jgi:hypothetical protein